MTITVFDVLGIHWDRKAIIEPNPPGSTERAVKRFRTSMPQFVWEAAQLEGNPYTFPEVQTLLDGVTVGGRKLSDTQQILGLRDSMTLLCSAVMDGSFIANKTMACTLNALIAKEEALEWGHFRGEGKERSNVSVNLGAETWRPKPTIAGGSNLTHTFDAGLTALTATIRSPIERALALKLFMCREQFFYDGNKRTARAVMNGVLMSHGFDGISIPAAKQLRYNQLMTAFYPTGKATEMMIFLQDCFAP